MKQDSITQTIVLELNGLDSQRAIDFVKTTVAHGFSTKPIFPVDPFLRMGPLTLFPEHDLLVCLGTI
jgi:hypothetical protein